MPSPFPGMDPYLEGSEWTTFHGQLVTVIAHQLTPLLQPRYFAFLGKGHNVGLAPEDCQSIYPDVGVSEARGPQGPMATTAIAPAPLLLKTKMEEEIPYWWVEIRDLKKRRLVTEIEILSPTNKRGVGRRKYLRKRQRLLHSSAHFLEIDLIRAGHRVPLESPLPDRPYFVFLTRANRRPFTEVWPIALEDALPTVPVPLLPGDADIPLDLQKAFTTVYDAGGFRNAVEYADPLEQPLSPDQAVWAEERLRAAGWRT